MAQGKFGARLAAVLGVCLFGTGPAAAQSDEGGIPLGPVRLHPSLTVSRTHDDNVALASEAPLSDWYTTAAPALRLVLPVRRFFLEAEGGLEALNYDELDSEDSTNWYVGAAGGASFPGGLDFRIGVRHAEEYLVSSQEFGPGETEALDTLAASAGYRIRDALRLELGLRRAAYDYELSLDRDRVETTLQGDCFWRFRPRTSAFVEAAVTDFAYEESAALDNSETLLALGLTWEATSRSTAHLKAGYEWKRYDDEDPNLGAEDGDYFVVAAGVRHDFTRRTAVQAELSRGSHESDFTGNPYYLRTGLAAGLSQQFTTRISGRLSLRYDGDDYPHAVTYDNPYDPSGRGPESGERSDRTFEARASVGYDARRWLTFEAAWETERRDSNFDTFDFEANRLSLSARAVF